MTRTKKEFSCLKRNSGENGDNLFELRDKNFNLLGVNTWSLRYIRNLKKDYDEDGIVSDIYQIKENGITVFKKVH